MILRFLLITCLLLLTCSRLLSQDIYFNWVQQLARNIAGSGDETHLVGVDSSNNVYVAANFTNPMDIDPGPGTFNVSGSGMSHIYICKLDPLGNFIWGKELGGNRSTILKAIFVDPAGNVYTTGYFTDTSDFDPGPGIHEIVAHYNSNIVSPNIFISKLDKDGNFQWAHSIGSDFGIDISYDINVDYHGYVYITGDIQGAADFDPTAGTAVIGSPSGQYSIFVASFFNNGNFRWVKEFQVNNFSYGEYIRTDLEGNVYSTGIFNGTADFDPGPNTFSFTQSSSSNTLYLSKLDSLGNFIWAKEQIGAIYGMAIDPANNIILNNNQISKYDRNGNLLWSKAMANINTTGYKTSQLACDRYGNIYIGGRFRYTTDFDPGPGEFYLTVMGDDFDSDVSICRLDQNGNFVYAKAFGGPSEDYAQSIVVDKSGNVITAGVSFGNVDYDPGPGDYTPPITSNAGSFIHKMSPCNNFTTSSLNISSCNSYTLNSTLYTISGTYSQTIPNTGGCDSIITLHLIIGGSNSTLSATACDHYDWQGNTYTSSGIYSDTLTSSNGCDSILNLNLTIKAVAVSNISINICEGDSYEGYTITGIYPDHYTASNGCDSTRVLHLTVNPKKYNTINQSICAGESFMGHNSTGTYSATLVSSAGCDSILTINLLVLPVYFNNVDISICEGLSYMGHSLPGVYSDTLSSISGCDSIQITTLKILKKPTPDLGPNKEICSGESLKLTPGNFQSYLWQDGSQQEYYTIKQTGVYSVTVSNNCGAGFDEVFIKHISCSTYFPNSFSPNNDGNNDFFKILNTNNISNYHLSVYNRYGQKIFETRNVNVGWNGTNNGLPAETGTYVWFCEFNESAVLKSLKGPVILIR